MESNVVQTVIKYFAQGKFWKKMSRLYFRGRQHSEYFIRGGIKVVRKLQNLTEEKIKLTETATVVNSSAQVHHF